MSDRVPMRPVIKRSRHQYSRSFDDDIHDSILVEILCRLPCCKYAFQLKCVSKRWSILINDPFFVTRFLCLQSRKGNPITRTLIFTHPNYNNKFFCMSTSKSKLVQEDLNTCSDFSFLQSVGCRPPPVLPCLDESIILLASYNDLVLCCKHTELYQRHYFICNPRTKQWRRLPPAPTDEWIVRVGFVCNPYYYNKDTDDIHLDFNNELKVVRIYSKFPQSSSHLINVEIFSSATREWTESTVTSPESFFFDHLAPNSGVVHKGMLHWLGLGGFVFVLDPSTFNKNNEDHIYSCDFIKGPQHRFIPVSVSELLGVCSGRMVLCQLLYITDGGIEIHPHLAIWDLDDYDDDDYDDNDEEEEEEEGEYRNKNCFGVCGRWISVDSLILSYMIMEKNPLIRECFGAYTMTRESIKVRAIHPEDLNILYLELYGHIVECNIYTCKLVKVNMLPYDTSDSSQRSVIPVALPWWPTPLPHCQ